MRTVGCIGDSLTRKGYPVYLQGLLEEATALQDGPGWQVSDFAVDGATATLGTDAYYLKSDFRKALQHGADVYVVLFGTNDSKYTVWHETSFLKDYLMLIGQFLLNSVREEPPRVLLVVPPPLASESGLGVQRVVVNEALPKLVRQLAEQVKLEVVDAFSQLGGASPSLPSAYHKEDGCHLSEHGDRVLANLVLDSLLHLVAAPQNTDAVMKGLREAHVRHSVQLPGSGFPGDSRRRLMDEPEGKTVAALMGYAGESLRLVGYCNSWKFRDDAYCFSRVPPGELCTGTEGRADYADALLVAPGQGAWRHQLTVLLDEGCLSFQVIGCDRLFAFRMFPLEPHEDGFFRLAACSPSSVRSTIGGEGDGHGCNFFIEEAVGTTVTIYVELLDSAAAARLKSGRSDAHGAGGTCRAAVVWYVVERRRAQLARPLRVFQEPGRQAPKKMNQARKFDSYYQHLMAGGGATVERGVAEMQSLRKHLLAQRSVPVAASR